MSTTCSRRSKALSLFAVATAAALGLAACGSGSDDAGSKKGDKVQVVATTNVYGSLAEAIGGDHVKVKSIINSVSQDPHSYEASPRDKLAFSKADLVITNGGGYDEYADQILDSLKKDPKIIVATDSDHAFQEATGGEDADAHEDHDHSEDADEHGEEGHHHHHGEANEHVWYNFHTVNHVAEHITKDLSKADPDHKADYQANAKKLTSKLDGLEKDLDALKADAKGKKYMMTEPVPKSLLEGAGLTDATPEGLSEAVEEGDEIPAATLNKGLNEAKSGDIAVFAYNAQTADDQTQKLRDAADKAGVPVIDFTETLPKGKDYVEWMDANTTALKDALTK